MTNNSAKGSRWGMTRAVEITEHDLDNCAQLPRSIWAHQMLSARLSALPGTEDHGFRSRPGTLRQTFQSDCSRPASHYSSGCGPSIFRRFAKSAQWNYRADRQGAAVAMSRSLLI